MLHGHWNICSSATEVTLKIAIKSIRTKPQSNTTNRKQYEHVLGRAPPSKTKYITQKTLLLQLSFVFKRMQAKELQGVCQ